MEPVFDCVVLSGGGQKGIGQLGALHYHHEISTLQPTIYAGTSVGSAISLLLACGYTPMEIFNRVRELSTFSSTEPQRELWANISAIITHFGLISVTTVTRIIEPLVIEKLGYIPTLGELRSKFGKTLVVSVFNSTKMMCEYFTPDTRPNLLTLDAVKISCAVPILFHRIRYDGCYYVDGGIGDNFPLDPVRAMAKRILGVLVTGVDLSGDETSFIDYVYRLLLAPTAVNTLLRARNPPENTELIHLNLNNAFLNIGVSHSERMEMFMCGYLEAKQLHTRKRMDIKGWRWSEVRNPKELWRLTTSETPSGWMDEWSEF